MIPGEIITTTGNIEINKGLKTKHITVKNTGDRAIQVGSHFHFFEVNKYLAFDRAEGYGYRLDIPSGMAIRFAPGEEKAVQLVALAGRKLVRGLNNLTDAQINEVTVANSLQKAKLKDFT